MKTGLDNEFHELNSIHLNLKQKNALWRNIQRKSKKSATFISFKNVAISILTVAVMLILTFNLIDFNKSKDHHSATPAPSRKVAPHKPLGNAEVRDNDSKGWQIVGRAYRYELDAIENLNLKQKELSQLDVKRIQSFKTDTDPTDVDPYGSISDEPKRTYTLQTILNQEVLQFHNGQKIILSFTQYQKGNSPDTFLGAKVLGYEKNDGKLYDMKGKLLNLTISSQVKIVDGVLKTQ